MATGALTETRYFQELEFKLDPSNDIQSWWEIPCISHFCSLFSSTFDLPDIDIEDLESALLCDGTDYQVGLVPELIVRLLKGCDALKCVANDITSSNYQMFLRRYLRQQCRTYNIENHFDTDIDFQSLAVRKRLLILHALCHFRLESRDVEVILSNLEADSLRVEPLGYDCKNSGYWYFYGTRLYREDIKNNNKTKIWQVVCFTEEDWQNLTRKFKSATNIKERALFNILNENFLPKLPQLFREREKLRRKKLLQTRNSSRIRNLVEVKARQEQERANAERLEITQLEQLILLEPPRATTYKTRRRRSQSTSTASGISTYASSLRPTTNSSDFLYQRETFCLTPDDIGAESISTNAPNQVDQTSQENQEKILNSEEVYKETLVTGQFKTKKQNISTKKIPKRWESGDCSSSTTEDKENYHSISDSESESENHTMAPTTNLKLPGRQTNNSLSSLPGNIFISPSIEGKDQEPLPPRRTSSSSGRVSVKKTKNHAGTTPTPETSSTTACTGPSTTNYEMTSFKNKKKNSSKSSSEDGTKNYFYSTTSINQTNPTIQPFNNKNFNKSPPNFLSFTETDEVLQIGMHKVLVCVKNHRDAWPFMDPVEEDIAPRYYTIIRRPMDLLKMEDKLDNGEYNKFSEFRNDFKLIVNNCRLYNGQNNEYTEMVNNLQEAFDKATKKYFDNLSDDDEDSANLNYPDSKMNVFREKYFNKEISEGDEENIDTATVNKKGPSELNKHIFKKSEKKEETDDDKIEPEMFTEFSGRSNKRKRKDKDKRRKKKSKCKTVAEVLAKEEIKSRKKKEKASTSGGRKTKKKFNSKQNVENKRKLKCNTALISQKEKKASDTGDETETEEIKPSETNKQLEKISQTNQKLKKATQVVIKKKSRAKETLGMRSKTLFTRYKIQTFRNEDENVKNDYVEEDNECEEQNKKERDGSRSRSVSPFKVDLHKKYAKSALNDDMKEKEEYDEADFKSVSTRSSSRESSIERPPTSLIIDVKPIFSKQTPKKIEYRKQISTSSCCDQSLTKNVKTNNNTFDVPLFLDKYDLIKQRRNRTNMEEKALNATKKEPKKMTATAAAATSLQATPLGRPRVRRESTEKLKAKTKDTEEEREKSIQEPKLEVEKIVFLEKQTKCVESQFILKDSEIQKINTNKAPKKSTILTTVAKKSAKDSEKTPAKKFIKKLVAATTTSSPIVSVSVESPRKAKLAFPSGKATNLEALELETEQTLKDINRWLEHTPRFPEFSSASNSPSRYNALLDDFDSVSTKLDAADFRRPVPIATPKIDLVPKLAESLDDLVAVAEVPNCKKDLITELIPAIGPSSVSSSCGTPPHSSISNNSGGSTSVNASSTSSLAMIPPIATCKPKEPSIIQIISNPPPPPNIKSQMQKEAKRKSLKEKLAGVSNLRRKDLIGTIDRLKPGKGKGNLIQNVNKQDEQFPLGVQQKVKEIKNALTVKTDDSVPKLSLGSVLDNDGFGLGHSHSFIDGKSEDDAEKETKEVKCESQDDSTEHKKGKPVSSLNEAPFEVKKISNSEPKADSSSATPNLSAWLKAFGVPKKAKKVDEDDSKQQQPKSNEAIVSYKSTDTNIQSLNLLKSPSSDNNHFSHPPPRTRKASTGSTISERSSFSQDPDSPRIAIDDRFGSYSGNYTSPIGASPIGASPIMVSPKPEDVGKPNSPYPLNGTIKVGFYQDTTTKSSPEKSCSPRELPSPYPQYSQHIYSSASSPNVSTTEMSGNSPYGGNSYAPSAGSEASKTPVYSSSSPIPNLYEQYKQPQSQESDYNSSMSPSTPNPHSPYQHPAQSPYQNHNSPYQQPSGANLQNQQQSSVPQSLSFQSTATDSPVVESILQNERVNSPAVSELQNQNSQYQQSANSSYQQQDTSPYTRNSESAYQPPNVFQDTSNASQQLAKVAKLTAVNPAQATQKSAPQSDLPNYDTAQQYLGFQHQQSCHQQQQQLQPQDVAMRTLYSLNKTPDWNMSQVNEQFQPPTYEHYAAAAISKDLLTQKTQDEYIQDPQSSSNSQKRHLDNENDVMNSDYKTKVAKRTDSQQLQHQQQQQQVNKQQQMYDSFLGSIGYGKHLDISPNKAFEMYNRAANMGFSKDYATSSTTKDQPLQQQRQLNQQQAVVDNSNMNKPLNMASTNSYNTQHHMVQQQQHQQQQQQNIYSKGQNTYPTNLSQASGPVAIDKPNDSVLSHLNAYKPQTYGSPTPSLLNINHHPLSTLIDESMLGLNQNTSSVSSNGMAAAGFYDKSIPPAAHMGTTSQMYQNINITPYGSHSNAISIELQQQSSNYAPSVGNSNNSTVPPSAQPLEVISLESKPVKKARSRKRTTISTSSAAQTVNDVSSKNNTAISQPQVSSTGIASSQVSNANAQQHINLHHTQMQNIQGFQLYAGLKTGVSTTSTMSSSTSASDGGAISLKTTAVAGASTVPGSAFNFGPSPAGLGLSAAGLYGDNTGYLDQFRDASNPYYMSTPTHRTGTSDAVAIDKSNNTAAASYPFLAHASSRTPAFNPFVNAPQLDANSPFYQEYMQRQDDFRARMMINQGLLGPAGPASYSQPGSYRASSLGMPKPYDINRQPWF